VRVAAAQLRIASGELDVVIVGGLCELSDSGELHNSAVLLDRDGLGAVYRKAHLWDREKEVFEPGSEGPPVLDAFRAPTASVPRRSYACRRTRR
jgi:predicted amidohydrolase